MHNKQAVIDPTNDFIYGWRGQVTQLGLKREFPLPHVREQFHHFCVFTKLLTKKYENDENLSENFRENEQILTFP